MTLRNTMQLRWRRAGLAERLFVAITLVIVAGAATLVLVALAAAPLLFRRHLEDAGVTGDQRLFEHIDDGFTVALVTSVTAAVLAAALVAVLVAAVIARRVSRPIGVAVDTARQLADGDYGVRMAAPSSGPELQELAGAINTLADRLEASEQHRLQLLGDLAHELRTPLAALEATVEALVDGVLPADAQTLTTLTDQTGRLSRLTRDLQAASRTDEHAFLIRRQHLDLTAVVAAVVASHQARYDTAGITLTAVGADAAAMPVVAWADPDRVTEILDQLLDNAARHCVQGQHVTLTVAHSPDYARVIVGDTGAGFDPATAEDLFTRFYRGPHARRHTAGTGVGLTIARALAEAQGGTLSAHSDGPGAGATFALALPHQPSPARPGPAG